MEMFEIASVVGAITSLAWGYRKQSRNWLLAGAIALWLSCAVPNFYEGYREGLQAGASHHGL